MGHSRCTCAHSLDSAAFCTLHFNRNNLPSSLRTFLRKMMIWELGLSCFFPKRPLFEENPTNSKTSRSSDQNKTWLLAESAGGPELTAVEPQSVHSSFRFSLCSQVEVETMNKNQSAAATILMVNLGSGLDDSDGLEHQRWRRIESLEKSILPFTRNTLIKFSFAEILSASHHFSKGRVLGRGARSYVFRGRVGILRTAVAIKRLDKEDKESSKAFCRELMIASSLRHPNVAPLIGFCIDAEEGFFLVYKYVSGGSLERHLHEKKKGNKSKSASLGWSKRYKVAVGIAEAIAHLHYGTGRCVVHRDIKPSNILLSSTKNPKLCDFGLASWTPAPSIPFLCKTVKGTFGYLAPEYFQHGKVSDKTDVYAFGVVLLELITGRKPIESKRPPGEENLVIWAKPLLQKGIGAAEELLDPRIKRTLTNSVRISLMIEAAAACINSEESRRPSINEIVAILRGENQTILTKIRTNNIPRNVVDYPLPLQQTKSEMNNHLALAMLGVSEINNDDDLFYWQ